ncbi:LysR substrate-binding domain-containing protein [Pseudomonas putida]|uniref:LysR substrate-binding domain-containing protein n=1 Tax=Pseudomonas putida TaxID=303 RepID=UPI00345C7DC1
MNNHPDLNDLEVFLLVARRSSFTAAASELGMSSAFVSKRIQILESQLQLKLLHRSTRRVSITEDGERIYTWAQSILGVVGQMQDEIGARQGEPSGTVRIVSSPGFGRRKLAPALSALSAKYPKLDIRLDIRDHLVDLAEEGVDLDIRVGNEIAPTLFAKKLVSNRRVLCASPHYLEWRGTPRSPAELGEHDCLVIKERDHPFGIWSFTGPAGVSSVKVTGGLSTNHGEIAHEWALEGMGILFRSIWDIRDDLEKGRLIHILPECFEQADVWAVHVSSSHNSPKIRATIQHLRDWFEPQGTDLALP